MEPQPQPQLQSVSPFLTIWVKPRATIRQIVETNPTKYVIPIAMLAGISSVLDSLSFRGLGDSMPLWGVLAIGMVLGSISGIFSLYFNGALYRWAGTRLGGQASTVELRAVIAWASVPVIVILPLWIPKLFIFGAEWFSEATPRLDASLLLVMILWGFLIIEIGMAIWYWVILINALAEVNHFSAWKAFGTVVLAALVVGIPIFLCMMLALSAL